MQRSSGRGVCWPRGGPLARRTASADREEAAWHSFGGGSDTCQPVTELCNGLDDDCDGEADDGLDVGAACTSGVGACLAAGALRCADDGATECDAAAGAPSEEACNQVDDDCDGQTDEELAGCCVPASQQACGVDQGVCLAGLQTCSGSGAWGGCLSGGLPVVLPGDRAEACNGLDDDCDGETDEGVRLTVYRDQDGDSWGSSAQSQLVCAIPDGWVAQPLDCDDARSFVHPGADELCDGMDDDCDGATDEELARPACPLQAGVCAGAQMACGGSSGWLACGAASYGGAYEAAEVSCDGLDNDCDGATDEGLGSTWYRDADGDGHGVPGSTRVACVKPVGYVASSDDCDDTRAGVYPGASELCGSGLDEDCDGVVDEPSCVP